MENDILNFSNVESPHKVDGEWVLARVSQESIFFQYFGEFVPYRKSYKSVFRKDNNPSTGFFYTSLGKLKYKDLRLKESWDCFSFVAKLYNISYFEAIKKVSCDFGLIDCNSAPLAKRIINDSLSFDCRKKEETIIQFIPDGWFPDARNYWKGYDIELEELRREHVFPVKKLYINKKFIPNRDNELRFAYIVPTLDKEYTKIYTPFASKKEFKFISNIPLHIPFGIDTLSYDSDSVFIGKSLKDMIVLKKIFPSVFATQNESEGALNNGMVKFLLKTFRKRIIIFDSDSVGIENCKRFNSRGFGYWNIPQKYYEEGLKDPSDFIKVYGLNKLRELFAVKGFINN